MITRIIAFTDRGMALARQLGEALEAEAVRGGKTGVSLSTFTEEAFGEADAIVYVGATGIAVRAIAPHIVHKAQDPAVVVVDEAGSFVIPLLSGHIGGANALARYIARVLSATAVITTATDINGRFAVDCWAMKQGCSVEKPELIKQVSSELLAGREAVYSTEFPISGPLPVGLRSAREGEAAYFHLGIHLPPDGVLPIVPKICVLGIGCKRDTSRELIEQLFTELLQEHRLSPHCVAEVCSIDVKANEPGLTAFCSAHNFPFETFSAEQLSALPGTFSASAFVAGTVGVDNVCERSAVYGSSGQLIIQKTARNGVTMAMAQMPFAPDWEYEA